MTGMPPRIRCAGGRRTVATAQDRVQEESPAERHLTQAVMQAEPGVGYHRLLRSRSKWGLAISQDFTVNRWVMSRA
jgi:hypothetical protein